MLRDPIFRDPTWRRRWNSYRRNECRRFNVRGIWESWTMCRQNGPLVQKANGSTDQNYEDTRRPLRWKNRIHNDVPPRTKYSRQVSAHQKPAEQPRVVWFAKFLVAHHVSCLRSNNGFYSRMMRYVGSNFLNILILSEMYRVIWGLSKNNDPGYKSILSNLGDFSDITTTFNTCKPIEAADIQLVKLQVKAYMVNGRQYMFFQW
jgi:hypothetical protein